MKKKFYIWAGILIILGVIIFLSLKGSTTSFPALDDFDGQVKYYKSPACGCCTIHSNYLASKGKLNVKNNIVSDQAIYEIKSQYGIPQELWSCHTIIMGDYFVEGHIPLEAINKLIEEKPEIAGIAMPGMPSGSPGMPGPKYTDFVIYAVNHDGTYYEFMRI